MSGGSGSGAADVASAIEALTGKDADAVGIKIDRNRYDSDSDAGRGRHRKGHKKHKHKKSRHSKERVTCTRCGKREKRCTCSDDSSDDEKADRKSEDNDCDSELEYSESESSSSSSSSDSDESSESDGDSNDSDSDSEHEHHRGEKHKHKHKKRSDKKKRHKKKLNLRKSLNAIDKANGRIHQVDVESRKELERQQSATDAAVDAALRRNMKVHRARKEACNAMHSRKPHKAHPARPKQVVEAYNNLIVARREQEHEAMILKARADAIAAAAKENGERAEALRKRHVNAEKALLAEMTVVRKTNAAHSRADKAIEAEAQCLADKYKSERHRRRIEHRAREASHHHSRSRSCSRERSCSRDPSPCRTAASGATGAECKYKPPAQGVAPSPGTVGGACAVTAAAVTAAQLGHAPGHVPGAPVGGGGGASKPVTISDLSTLMSALQQQLMEYSASRAEQIVSMNKDSLRALTAQVNDLKNSRCC